MPIISLLQRLKLRHKIAALGVVGMALCTLPLIQVLRYQGLELQWARAAHDQLEPAVLAVELQRGLVEHRASAAQWLRGQREVDAQRRQDQAVVDARLAMLDHRLEPTDHLAAQSEVRAMRGDWLQLVQQVVDQRCSVADSDGAHRLLVEQALQVIDNVTTATASTPDASQLLQAVLQVRTHLQAEPPAWPAAAATLAAAQAAVQEAQAQRLALHQALRTTAAATLLSLVAGIVGLLGWLLAVRRRQLHPSAGPEDEGTATGWPQTRADGQQDLRSTRQSLLQRLRQPAPAAPRLEQPTEPQREP